MAALPWRQPRHELLLLVLVAATALLPVYPQDPQDAAHLCLSSALAHGHVSADACLSDASDRARYGSHLYSDKAPALAVVALPAVELIGLGKAPERWPTYYLNLWGVRLLSAGIAFLACAFLFGRVSEGLAPGYGAGALVAFSLGTLMAPLAATGFAHVLSALLLFGAFLLAWRRSPFLAGLAAGTAVLSEYTCGLGLAIIAAYSAATGGLRPLLRYLVGVLPAAVLLGLYDWAAFGAPWHLSYRYIDNLLAGEQATGFFGIGTPHLVQAFEVLAGPDGLLVISPVLVLAALGLAELARERRAEALTCAAIALAFLLVNFGYFLPYGGLSPGPRFLVPGLPFLGLGIGPAFRRFPRLTAAATVVSVASTTAVMLIWPANEPMRNTVWGEIVRVPFGLGQSRYVRSLGETALHSFGLGKSGGAVLVVVLAAASLAVGLGSIRWRRLWAEQRADRRRPWRVTLVAGACLVAVADVSAAFAYPYGNRTAGTAIGLMNIVTTITPNRRTAAVGDEVDFVITVDYQGHDVANQLLLDLDLTKGMHLLGPPAYTIGSGCAGTSAIVCNLDYLPAFQSTQIRLGVRITEPSNQTISASTTSAGAPGYTHPKVTIPVTP
jgi:hypothetical protein